MELSKERKLLSQEEQMKEIFDYVRDEKINFIKRIMQVLIVGTNLNTDRSTYRTVKSIDDEKISIPKGKNTIMNISWDMLFKCYKHLKEEKGFSAYTFQIDYPEIYESAGCHVATIGQIFIYTDLAFSKKTGRLTAYYEKYVFETIDNETLILNNLEHIKFEFGKDKPSYFRVAREFHQVLLRTMVEALKGSANLAITTTRQQKPNIWWKYHQGDKTWLVIRKIGNSKLGKAWRFSKPVPCEPPPKTTLSEEKKEEFGNGDLLIGFYELLAMIQTECHMCKVYLGKPVFVSDNDMIKIDWLHRKIRNEYEHFIPMSFTATCEELMEVSKICNRIVRALYFEANTIMPYISFDNIEEKLNEINEILNKSETFEN